MREPAKIQIIGQCASGKTTLAHIIKDALLQHGIAVEINDDEDHVEPYLHGVNFLKGKTVAIETVQLNRNVMPFLTETVKPV